MEPLKANLAHVYKQSVLCDTYSKDYCIIQWHTIWFQRAKTSSCNPPLFDANNRNEVDGIVNCRKMSLGALGCLDVP